MPRRIDNPLDPDYEEPGEGPQEGDDGYPDDFADGINGYISDEY